MRSISAWTTACTVQGYQATWTAGEAGAEIGSDLRDIVRQAASGVVRPYLSKPQLEEDQLPSDWAFTTA